MSAQEQAKLAKAGEKLAARFLKRRGFKLLAHNVQCGGAELDIIALDGDVLVFVEVKTRRDETFAAAEEAVNFAKQRRMARAARSWIRRYRQHDRPARFDVVAVHMPHGQRPLIRHTESAFPLPGSV